MIPHISILCIFREHPQGARLWYWTNLTKTLTLWSEDSQGEPDHGRVNKDVRLCCFFFFFLPHHTACGILVPWPGIKPMPPALEVWSLNHWTARDFPKMIHFNTASNNWIHSPYKKEEHLPQAQGPCTPPIQGIPGIAKCPCPWATILMRMASIICRIHQCITRALGRLRTQDPSSLHTHSLSPHSSLTIHSSNMSAQKLSWFSSKGKKYQPCNKCTKLYALVTIASSTVLNAVYNFCLQLEAVPQFHTWLYLGNLLLLQCKH